jgi:hypothetical protein
MKKIIPLIVLISIAFIALPVYAQSKGELILDFNRDFGYGGFGGDIQGRFSMKVSSPDDIVRVEYFLDDELVFEGTEPEFRWQFNTAVFPEGHHTFSAIGYKADGTAVHASEFSRVFLSSDQAWTNTGDIIVPLLVIVGVATLGGVLGPVLLGRKKVHTPGVYGMAGGAVCTRCSFPFSRSMVAPNLLVGKLERCPHCGKWALVPRASAGDLKAADERFAFEGHSTIEAPTEEEILQQMIDDSRYEE